MITTILTALGIAIAAIFGFIGHWVGARGTDKKVEQAKVATEAQTRTVVAQETAQAATTAQADAIQTRQDAEQSAHATAQQGTAALDQALADKGALRD